VLRFWWKELDPKHTGLVTQASFVDFAIQKKILGRESEKEKLIKKTIGVADQMQGKFKILTNS
jgi:hypothetical protein